MSYKLPDKSLLEERSSELSDDSKYYNLSKITYKKDLDNKLLFPVGINPDDKYYIDLEHKSGLLILGETGSGKSVFINSIIISLLLKNTPEDLKFLFIDPRGAELGLYNGIPHLLKNVIRTREQALYELEKLSDEIDKRQKMFVEAGVKWINNYNERCEKKLPHIIVVIDEATDIISNKHFEDIILQPITDGYRYGIHIIMATNSSLKEKLSTFLIRAFDYVLTFDLASKEQADYIKINEADLLTVYGEALIRCNGEKTIDLQTPYVSDEDINKIVDYIKNQK